MSRKVVNVDTDKTAEQFVAELQQESPKGELTCIANISFFENGLVRGSIIGDVAPEILKIEVGRLLDVVERENN